MLIGIAGRAQNGKSTIASLFQALAESGSFSPVLYDIGGLVLRYCKDQGYLAEGLTREVLSAAELDVLVRVGKQKREQDPEFWIGQIGADYAQRQGPLPTVGIVPNLRYKNEVGLVRRFHGSVIRVTALNADGSEYISPDRDPNHPSETQLRNLNADYNLIVKRGENELLLGYAKIVFEDIRRRYEEEKWP